METRNTVGTYILYDDDGNIMDSFVLNEGERVIHALKGENVYKQKTQEQKEIIKHRVKSDDLCSQIELALGGFYWVIYYDNKLFDNKIDIKHIARVMYLATFIDYESNMLVIVENGKQKRPFTEKDIKEKIGLVKSQAYKQFKTEMINNKILQFEENGIYLSDEWFFKGEIKQYTKQIKKANGCFSRVYVETIRTLFEGLTDTRQHKTLGYLFQLLPYCDYNYNIITKEPYSDKIGEEILTKKDIANLLNVDFKAYERIEKQLKQLVIKVKDIEYYVLGRATLEIGDKVNTFYVINPFIFNSQKKNDFLSLESLWIKLRR